jgi:hypothetical protein
MRLERHRGGAESAKSKSKISASYARIAIHIREFSPQVGKMTQRTRNKIALVPPAALRLFPTLPLKLCQPQDPDQRVEES